jgi:hypothetical protein
MPYVVQFPHPGGEHRPPDASMPWNVGPHRRKFLRCPGRYVRDVGAPAEAGDLVFWGEWEPPSVVERRWRAAGDLPQALHRPHWVRPRGGGRQNTDPWVFGDRMLYSNCRQTLPGGGPSALQRLDRGSVICFGSTIRGAFCVDTVFVVASARPWDPQDPYGLELDPAFTTCTADAITSKGYEAATTCAPTCAPLGPLTLYCGATVDDPVDGMYSFVPARRADDPDARFERPAVVLDDIVNPLSTQAARGATRPLDAARVRQAWDDVRRQVLDADLVLGTWFQTPTRKSDEDLPVANRTAC